MEKSTFPDALKKAQVVPIHKKNIILEKGNYRPVSVLPNISKLLNVPSIANLQSISIVFLILFWQHFDLGMAVNQLFSESLKTGKEP